MEDSIDDIFDSMDVSGSASALDISGLSLDESLFNTSVDFSEDESLHSSFASFSSDDGPSSSADAPSDHERYLFEGSKVTAFQSYLMIMKYTLRHRLTKLALSDLLDLVGIHLPDATMLSSYRYVVILYKYVAI